jgi:acetyltransferase-like isoleucine patch superfamily enzyme
VTISKKGQLEESRYILCLKKELQFLRKRMLDEFNRHVSLGDLFFNRWETAEFYGFGEGTSCYNNVLIIGDVKVGKNCWIGPNVILDGSGGLEIGDFCSISAGVQIYSHHSVEWSTSLGENSINQQKTMIGNGVYIGPNSIIQKGVKIGDQSVIGAITLVNKDIPNNSKFYGGKIN